MAHAITFDTLAFVKRLEKAGMESKKSEAIAEALVEVFDNSLSTNIFTKQDGELLKFEIEGKLSKFDAKLSGFDAKLSKLEAKLVMWVIGLLFAQSAIIVSIVKFLN